MTDYIKKNNNNNNPNTPFGSENKWPNAPPLGCNNRTKRPLAGCQQTETTNPNGTLFGLAVWAENKPNGHPMWG